MLNFFRKKEKPVINADRLAGVLAIDRLAHYDHNSVYDLLYALQTDQTFSTLADHLVVEVDRGEIMQLTKIEDQ